MQRRFTIILAAGGTGGHVIPAQAVAVELSRRGHTPILVTDPRGLRYKDMFPGIGVMELKVSPASGSLVAAPLRFFKMLFAIVKAVRILRRARPCGVVGFGGYPSLPTGLAARMLGIPVCLHEQNAVFGRTNRLLSRFAAAVALSYPETQRLKKNLHAYVAVTGNPVRQAITALRHQPYAAPQLDGPFNLLVIGGSQGAQVLSDVVPAALSALPPALQQRLKVVQQCRDDDMLRVRASYAAAGIGAYTATFLNDLPQRLAMAHLVIARAGASTITELAIAGRPSVLVPLPTATDDHQWANAQELAAAGGAWLVRQKDFTPAALAKIIQTVARNPDRLQAASKAARKAGRTQAAAAVADLAEQMVLAHGPVAAITLPPAHPVGGAS